MIKRCIHVDMAECESAPAGGFFVSNTMYSRRHASEEAVNACMLPINFEGEPSITQETVDDFIKDVHVQTIGSKTTVVHVVLKNGFEMVESSSCVSPSNYNEELGKEICMERIKNRIWELLGFLLQTAMNGFNW